MNDKSTKPKLFPVIGFSIGDINGIGPEITLKAIAENRQQRNFTPVIYASGYLVSYLRKKQNLEHINFQQIRSIEEVQSKRLNVVNVWSEKIEIQHGIANEIGGKYARLSLEAATKDLKDGKIHALVTAPLSKEWVKASGFEYPGHTEYLAHTFGVKDNLMIMVSGELRVAVATSHIPLSQVSSAITHSFLEQKIKLFLHSLKDDFSIKKPRIAILGLNPHAGENGMIGDEEENVIKPVIKNLKDKGHLIFGPYSADGFFGSAQYAQFDGIMAMYHDQGLIPFKHISQGEGVNFTAGIPAIRTSPAHGTAFNLAGKNIAEASSMMAALYLAQDMIKNKFEFSAE